MRLGLTRIVVLLCAFSGVASAQTFDPTALPDFEHGEYPAADEPFTPPLLTATFEEPMPAATPNRTLPPVSRHSPNCCGDGRCGWNAGAGVYVLQPRWTANPALYTFTPGGGFGSLNEQNFDWSAHAAPFVWLGYTGRQGTGLRVQWFGFNAASRTASATQDNVNVFDVMSPVVGSFYNETLFAGDTLSANSRLTLSSFDAEVTKAFNYRRGSYVVSGGLRYAYIRQSYETLLDDGVVQFEQLLSSHNDSVAGPTAALSARYPSRFFPHVGFYGRARGAVLIGRRHRTVNFGIPGFPFTADFASADDTTLPVAELEAGFDWNRNIGGYGLFLQTGLVAQSWFGVGNASQSTSTPIPFLGPGPGSSATDTSNLSLVGLRATVGFNY